MAGVRGRPASIACADGRAFEAVVADLQGGMLLVPTYVAPSSIQGLGLFAAEAISAGEALWRFEPEIDVVIPFERVERLPAAFRAFLDRYAYTSHDIPGGVVVSCDHAKFMNHSEDPNTEIRPFVTVARRPIAKGEEITCDYRACCAGWQGFGDEAA
jgi:uncharacterized protein